MLWENVLGFIRNFYNDEILSDLHESKACGF